MKDFFILLIVITFISCDNSKKELEKKYQAIFNKEYSGFTKSERFTSFSQRYKAISELTKLIDESDSVPLEDSTETNLTFCFISSRQEKAEGNLININRQKSEKGEEIEERIIPFAEYPNFSKDVNAIFIGSGFYKEDHDTQGMSAYEFHKAYDWKDDDFYFKKHCGVHPTKEYLYESFCEDRIKMDEINNCQYAVIIKTFDSRDGEILAQGEATGIFISGTLNGIIYVYDLKVGKIIRSVNVEAHNSQSVRGGESALEENLIKNYNEAVIKILGANFKINGEPIYFYYHL